MAAQGESPGKPRLDEVVSRRDFLTKTIIGGAVLGFLGMIAPAVVYLWPARRAGPGTRAVNLGRLDEFAVWSSKMVPIDGRPVLVFRDPDGVKAFSASCTHLGCLVALNASRRIIECPCHAGTFDLSGRVLTPPAPTPLPSYKVSTATGEIIVQL